LDSENTHRELQDNEADKQDILKFVEHLQEKDKSIIWIIRCITALLQLRKRDKETLFTSYKRRYKEII
jgi:hypothetical protein